jgi:hypothetical protein
MPQQTVPASQLLDRHTRPPSTPPLPAPLLLPAVLLLVPPLLLLLLPPLLLAPLPLLPPLLLLPTPLLLLADPPASDDPSGRSGVTPPQWDPTRRTPKRPGGKQANRRMTHLDGNLLVE